MNDLTAIMGHEDDIKGLCEFCDSKETRMVSKYQGKVFCEACYPTIYAYVNHVESFKANFGDEDDILPMTYDRWLHAKITQDEQGRLHAEAMRSLDN